MADPLSTSAPTAHSSALPGQSWFCVAVLSNLEHTAEADLHRLGFTTFFPKVKTRKYGPGQPAAIVLRPLFPGYAFLRFNPLIDPWHKISDAKGVYKLFKRSATDPIPIPASVIQPFIDATNEMEVVTPRQPEAFKPGDQVRIIGGPLFDHLGICLWSDQNRVLLLCNFLSGEVKISLPRSLAEAA